MTGHFPPSVFIPSLSTLNFWGGRSGEGLLGDWSGGGGGVRLGWWRVCVCLSVCLRMCLCARVSFHCKCSVRREIVLNITFYNNDMAYALFHRTIYNSI